MVQATGIKFGISCNKRILFELLELNFGIIYTFLPVVISLLIHNSKNYSRKINCFQICFIFLLQKSTTTVRFFDRSDYYSVHGEDSHLAAKCVFKSISSVKTMKPDSNVGLDYLCLSKGNFEILLRDLLLVKNYRVELFTIKVMKLAKSDQTKLSFIKFWFPEKWISVKRMAAWV